MKDSEDQITDHVKANSKIPKGPPTHPSGIMILDTLITSLI